MKFKYVVCVYKKDTDTLAAKLTYLTGELDKYENACAGLDCATNYYYDVEVTVLK